MMATPFCREPQINLKPASNHSEASKLPVSYSAVPNLPNSNPQIRTYSKAASSSLSLSSLQAGPIFCLRKGAWASPHVAEPESHFALA